jgi:hypothetical protein
MPLVTTKLPVRAVVGYDANGELLRRVAAETDLDLRVADALAGPLSPDGEFVMICNPPYGERIKIDGKRGSFLRAAWEKFLTVDRPKRFGWVLPSDLDDLFRSAPGYRLLTQRRLRNGGFAVTYWVWERGP